MTPAEARLEQLAQSHGPRVLGYLARRVTPREDAADIYQLVLTTAWRRIHTIPQPRGTEDSAALCWMLAVARRELANYRRGAARRLAATDRLRASLATSEGQAHVSSSSDPAVDRLHRALVQLGAEDREVLELTYWEELTSEEIAVVLDARAVAVRKRLQRARERLTVILRTAPSVDGEQMRLNSAGCTTPSRVNSQ